MVQLFDTWAGELSREDYEEFALPYTQKIFEEIGNSVPRILYINGCAAILESMARSGADVLERRLADPDRGSARARRQACRAAGKSGSVPAAGFPRPNLTATAERILKEAGPTGHIFNLGHGILPMTPVENARAFIDFVKSYRHSAMKLGVLSFNLGGPETLRDVKPFLYQLFSDPEIIRIKWSPLRKTVA